jgi:hypothetical protein
VVEPVKSARRPLEEIAMPRRPLTPAVVAALAVPTAAIAAPPAPTGALPCGERAAMVATLEDRYGERAVATGLETSGQLVEVFASPRTGSWTILATGPDGTSCIMAVGEHYERLAPPTDATARRDGGPA